MAFDQGKAFGVNQGIFFNNGVGLFSASGSPVGSAATITSYYWDSVNGNMYFKFGGGVNDWRRVDGRDFVFDPTGLPNFIGTETNIKEALETFGNQTFAQATNFDEFEDNTQQDTTSDVLIEAYLFTTNDGAPSPSNQNRPTGKYVVFIAMNVGQTLKQKKVRVQINARTSTVGAFTVLNPLDTNETLGSNNSFKLFSGLALFEHTDSDEPFQIQVAFGDTVDGGTGSLKNCKVVTWKVNTSE